MMSDAEARWRRDGVLTTSADGSLRLEVHVQPGAKTTEAVGLHGDRLKVRLAAPPVDGKANDALLAFVAESLGVPRSAVTVVRGQTSRQKTVGIER